MPPKNEKQPQRGRPKGKVLPRKTVTVRLEIAHVAWVDQNLPRSVTLSDFLNEALIEKIARTAARA